MRDHTRYWLSLVAEYTDLAVMPADAGMHEDAIPRQVVKPLGSMVKKVKQRVTITAAGRRFLKGDKSGSSKN